MPDPLSPSDDELVSAYLDGEASADEIARVESSPELLAEVETLRAVAALVASDPDPATVDPGRRDAHIAAALAASSTAANVTGLSAARARPWYRQPVAAVAAVLLAAVIAVPLLANLGGDDADSDVATSASDDAATDEAAATTPAADARAAEPDEGFLAEEAGDEAADAGSGDDAAGDDGAAAPTELDRPSAADAAFALLTPSAGLESFASVAEVAAAYDDLRDLADDDDEGSPATTAQFAADGAESAASQPCAEIFDGELFVAVVDDVGEVLVGTIDDETVVVVADDPACVPIFPVD